MKLLYLFALPLVTAFSNEQVCSLSNSEIISGPVEANEWQEYTCRCKEGYNVFYKPDSLFTEIEQWYSRYHGTDDNGDAKLDSDLGISDFECKQVAGNSGSQKALGSALVGVSCAVATLNYM